MNYANSPDIAKALGALWERMGTLTDHVIETKDQVSEVKDQVSGVKDQIADIRVKIVEGDGRMTKTDGRIRNLERLSKSEKRGTWTGIKGFLMQVASVKQWLTGAAVVFLAIEASRNPGELKLLMQKLLDVGLK